MTSDKEYDVGQLNLRGAVVYIYSYYLSEHTDYDKQQEDQKDHYYVNRHSKKKLIGIYYLTL